MGSGDDESGRSVNKSELGIRVVVVVSKEGDGG